MEILTDFGCIFCQLVMHTKKKVEMMPFCVHVVYVMMYEANLFCIQKF
jgi:hypothetical protein